MESAVETKGCVLFAKSHDIAFPGSIQIKENINTSVCYHTIDKGCVKCMRGFELPVTIDERLQDKAGQELAIYNIISMLLYRWLLRVIEVSYVFKGVHVEQ